MLGQDRQLRKDFLIMELAHLQKHYDKKVNELDDKIACIDRYKAKIAKIKARLEMYEAN